MREHPKGRALTASIAHTSILLALPPSLLSPPVINKETSVKTSVGETIVTRGYDFLPPDARKTMGSLYVPILRISIIQLELTHLAIERDFFEMRNVGSSAQ